jgi:hypothetical protein
MTRIDEILNERRHTHGPYTEQARVSQMLKEIARATSRWNHLPMHQKESVDMIMHKLARVLTGDNSFRDHWDDISGYSILSANEIDRGSGI